MRKALGVGLVASLMLASLLVLVGFQGQRNFGWIVASKLTVQNDSTFNDSITVGDDLTTTDDVTVGDDLTVTDAASVGGDLTVTAGAVVGTDFNLAEQTAITVTQSGTLTPTGSYQPITAAGDLSFSAIAAGSAGDVLTVINESNTTITITDTGTTMLSGNAALGQYDSIMMLFDGTNWIEVAQTDN